MCLGSVLKSIVITPKTIVLDSGCPTVFKPCENVLHVKEMPLISRPGSAHRHSCCCHLWTAQSHQRRCKSVGLDTARFVERHFYVDDYLTSIPSLLEVIDFHQKTQLSFAESSLHLYKFTSNSPASMQAFCPEGGGAEPPTQWNLLCNVYQQTIHPSVVFSPLLAGRQNQSITYLSQQKTSTIHKHFGKL